MAPSSDKRPDHALPHFEWRGVFENNEVNALHCESFEHGVFDGGWWARVCRFSPGRLTMRVSCRLAGFVTVAWDGCVHVFLLHTMVGTVHRRCGHASELARLAAPTSASTMDSAGGMYNISAHCCMESAGRRLPTW